MIDNDNHEQQCLTGGFHACFNAKREHGYYSYCQLPSDLFHLRGTEQESPHSDARCDKAHIGIKCLTYETSEMN